MNQKLQCMHLPQGYINVLEGHKPPQERVYDYVYQYKDHLEDGALKNSSVDCFSERARRRARGQSFAFDRDRKELRTLTEHNYYPFGLEHSYLQTRRRPELVDEPIGEININSDPNSRSTRMVQVDDVRYQYKYNGKELQDELGLSIYDFGWRNYDPAIGRWMNIDPLAERRHELTTYNYVQNSPLFRFDPDGLTDFTINKKGQIKQVSIQNDDPDVLYQGNSKGEIKRKGDGFLGFLVRKSERGKKKVAVEKVEKGILKDGQNFKENGVAYKIGGEGNPSREGIESFAIKLSNYLNVEVGGAYASENNNGVITHMTIGKYKGNTTNSVRGGLGLPLLREFYDVNQNQTSILGHFHVHPGGTRVPSPADEETKDSWMKKYKSSIFIILINNHNEKNGYESIPY